jgi:hypothetical protein
LKKQEKLSNMLKQQKSDAVQTDSNIGIPEWANDAADIFDFAVSDKKLTGWKKQVDNTGLYRWVLDTTALPTSIINAALLSALRKAFLNPIARHEIVINSSNPINTHSVILDSLKKITTDVKDTFVQDLVFVNSNGNVFISESDFEAWAKLKRV